MNFCALGLCLSIVTQQIDLKHSDVKQQFHLATNVWFGNSGIPNLLVSCAAGATFKAASLPSRLVPPGSLASIATQHVSSSKSSVCGFDFSQHGSQAGLHEGRFKNERSKKYRGSCKTSMTKFKSPSLLLLHSSNQGHQ